MRSPNLGIGGERDETGDVEYRQPDCQRHQNDVYFAEHAVEEPLPRAVGLSVCKRGGLHLRVSPPASEALTGSKLQRKQTARTDLAQILRVHLGQARERIR